MTRSNQQRVTSWVKKVFDDATRTNIKERALRVVEEAIELAQVCGVERSTVHRLVDYVYWRPAGEAWQEIGGIMVTVYAAAHALNVDGDTAFETELDRIQRPEVIERIQRRQIEKREAMVTGDNLCGCGRQSEFKSGWCGRDCGRIP